MRTLAEALNALRPAQREAIARAISNADGAEYVDDVAFVAQLLVELMDLHEQTPVEWCIVTAHKALLKIAQNEGIIPAEPRVKHERRASKFDEMAKEMDIQRGNAQAMNQALVTERRAHDREVYELRQEIQGLNQELAALRSPRPDRPPPTRIPGPGVLPYRKPSLLARLWQRVRGGRA
ncbi:MAG TPA: hypothetical protein VJZ73_13315 [Methylomirabilota bacterium]|nr:hypothetical protein [Methylomirabilota bacterium]